MLFVLILVGDVINDYHTGHFGLLLQDIFLLIIVEQDITHVRNPPAISRSRGRVVYVGYDEKWYNNVENQSRRR